MKINKIIAIALAGVCLSGCGLYKKYESTVEVPAQAYGLVQEVAMAQQKESLGEMPWQTFFVDPLLRTLIDSALVRNTDMQTARIRVEEAQVLLSSAKMAFLPSLTFAPQGSVGSLGGSSLHTYDLSVRLELPVSVFGGLANAKRRAVVLKKQADVAVQHVQTNLVASVAQVYCRLQLLDRYLQITEATEVLWSKSLETLRALMQNGRAYSTAVQQLEASHLGVKAQILDIHNEIRDMENALCLLLNDTPVSIARSVWGAYELPRELGIGVPAALLSCRPDVRMAELDLEAAHYDVNLARSAFYPQITLGGNIGWTNNGGSLNPAQWLLNATASLVQPLFAQGKLRAQYKQARLEQQNALNQLAHAILVAGNDVNAALRGCQLAHDKDAVIKQQVAVLQKAYDGTHILMNNGKATYLEVLTAQEAYLNAQLQEAANLYNGTESLIALYVALGGGR